MREDDKFDVFLDYGDIDGDMVRARPLVSDGVTRMAHAPPSFALLCLVLLWITYEARPNVETNRQLGFSISKIVSWYLVYSQRQNNFHAFSRATVKKTSTG